jgi:type I restriction enzyme S subunit
MVIQDLIVSKDGLIKGPFGGDIKKSLFVPKSETAYKVYEQGIVINKDINYGNYYVSLDYFNKHLKRFEVKENDILMTGAGTLGELFTVPSNAPKGVINQALLRIRLNDKVIEHRFFCYYFKYYIKSIISNINGDSVIPNLPPLPILKSTKIDIPVISYQNKISNVLSSIDSKIELNNRINAELEAMAKTLYDYWFVQFDFPAPSPSGWAGVGLPYKTSGGKLVWNEELKREIPEGWEVKTLSDLLIKYTDKSVHIESKNILIKGKYPVITQDNGDFIAGFTNEVNPIVDFPVIVFGDHSCTLRYIDFSFYRGADGTQIMSFSQDLTIYVYLYLHSIIKQIPGYGKYERHYKYLKEFDIIIPESQYLKSFQIIIKPIFDKISQSRFENQKLSSLRDWLLPMLMNGQVKVKDTEEEKLSMAAEPEGEYK